MSELIGATSSGTVETAMKTEPTPPRPTPIGKRGLLRKNGPTKRVEIQPLSQKAAKAAAAQKAQGLAFPLRTTP